MASQVSPCSFDCPSPLRTRFSPRLASRLHLPCVVRTATDTDCEFQYEDKKYRDAEEMWKKMDSHEEEEFKDMGAQV